MNKINKIFIAIIILLSTALIIMTYFLAETKKLNDKYADEVIATTKEVWKLNEKIEELEKTSIHAVTNTTSPGFPREDLYTNTNSNPNINSEPKAFNRSPENISFKIIENTLTSSGASFLITDNNEDKYGYGADYKLQIKKNNQWTYLEPHEPLNFIAIAYNLNKDNQLKQDINWSKFYGKLQPGIYRIEKALTYDESLYSDEFEIK